VIVFVVFFALSAAATLAWALSAYWHLARAAGIALEQDYRARREAANEAALRNGRGLLSLDVPPPVPVCGPHERWFYCHRCTVAEIEASLKETV
jgi:hypothetical protein